MTELRIKAEDYIAVHKNSIIVWALVLLCGFMIFRGLMQIPQIQSTKSEISRVREQIEYEKTRQQETDELSKKVGSDEYIEKVASEKLGLVKSNEKIFVDVSQENQQ